MKRRTAIAAIAAVAVTLTGLACTGVAAESKVKLGEKMPDFTLQGIDGKEYTLSKVVEKGPAVLIFSSQKCPYSQKADPVLSKLYKVYKNKGVTFLSIDSHKATPLEEINAYAKEKELAYVVLKDPANEYADAVGAQKTPEVFIVGKDSKLLYHGGPNNQKDPEDAEFKDYVKGALDDILGGNEVATPKTKTFGCTIKRVA
jgi:peroxiredoxin